jgi:hypothetical protein
MRYSNLFEAGSRGLFVRTQDASAGTNITFYNKEGQSIKAVGNVVFPETSQFYPNDTVENLPKQARKLPPAEQKKLLKTGNQKLLDDLDAYKKKAKIADQNWHIINTVGRAALVTIWKNSRNETIAYIKLFNTKSMGAIPFFWSNSNFARDTGYGIQNVAQQKSELNLKPSTVVGTGEDLALDEIIEQVGINIQTHTEIPSEVRGQVIKLVNNVYSGFDTLVANATPYANSYEIDLGETVAPIALLTGHFVTGSYREAEEQLLKPLGSSWRKIKSVGYPMSSHEALVDSYLNLGHDTHIGISSKDGKGGAAASVTSLSSAIEQHPERYEDMGNERKYKYLFNILNLIKDKSAEDGPLDLGIIYKIITKEEKAEIKQAIVDPHTEKRDVSKNLRQLLKNPIYQPITTNQNYTIGYHLLTVVAHLVTAHLNKNTTLVTAFFKEILSRSNMIQVKTKMKKVGNAATFSEFQVIWPPAFTGKVKFNSNKNYSATSRPGGKICFKIG